MLNLNQISSRIQNSTGIKIYASLERLPDKDLIHVRPHGFQENKGIRIESSLRWLSLISELHFEDYAQDVVDYFLSNEERKAIFQDLIQSLKSQPNRRIITTSIEDSSLISFTIEETPIDVNLDTRENYIAQQCIDIINAILVFFDKEVLDPISSGLPEGAKTIIEVNKYERSKINRLVCIQHYGAFCQACDFDFKKVYGEMGKGFIHVHHVVPVSDMNDHYVVNPIKDLIPLCPNCHAIVHLRKPPVTIQELKEMLDSTKRDMQ